MFDRLIESETTGADFKPRRRYFIISSVVVGLLFFSAVVISLYATDIGLGNDNYELSAMIAPVAPPAQEPERPRPERQRDAVSAATNDRPMRIVRQASIAAEPRTIPPISYNPNQFASLPGGPVEIGPTNKNGGGPIGAAPEGSTSSSSESASPRVAEIIDERPPKAELPPPARPRSLGVVNGIAIDLPKPSYPPVAIATNSQGKVDVQITIDERGRVVSAKAVAGPSLLRQASEQAALRAKFRPTYLSNIPVKVTGVIVYNFTRN